jgi:RNA polymerase sigma-70 factor (ECF subfamily)
MTDEGNPTPEFLEGVKDGDAKVVARLFQLDSQRLARLAEQHLSRKVAGRLDGEDVVQSVFRTFFRRSAQGEFQVDSSGQIWQLLAKITLMKARSKGQYHTAGVCDVGTELPAGGEVLLSEAAAHEPGPAEAAALVEQIEGLLRGLPPLYATVLEMRLRGCSAAETAPALGVSRRTVERALDLLQERLARDAPDNRP